MNIEENGSADIDLGTSILVNAEGDIRARVDVGLSSLSMDMKTTFLSEKELNISRKSKLKIKLIDSSILVKKQESF